MSTGFFPYTPATNLLYGLREAIAHAEARKVCRMCLRAMRGLAEATRCAARPGDLEMVALDPTGIQ